MDTRRRVEEEDPPEEDRKLPFYMPPAPPSSSGESEGEDERESDSEYVDEKDDDNVDDHCLPFHTQDAANLLACFDQHISHSSRTTKPKKKKRKLQEVDLNRPLPPVDLNRPLPPIDAANPWDNNDGVDDCNFNNNGGIKEAGGNNNQPFEPELRISQYDLNNNGIIEGLDTVDNNNSNNNTLIGSAMEPAMMEPNRSNSVAAVIPSNEDELDLQLQEKEILTSVAPVLVQPAPRWFQVLTNQETLAVCNHLISRIPVHGVTTVAKVDEETGKTIETVTIAKAPKTTAPSGQSLDDVSKWVNFLANDTEWLGEDTEAIVSETGNNTSSDGAKVRTLYRFIITLRDHKQLGPLAHLVKAGDGMTFRFIALVAGPKDTNKYKAINAAMLYFGKGLRKKGYKDKPDDPNGFYEPNSTRKFYIQLFTVLKQYGCEFEHKDFATVAGTYQQYFKKKFEMVVAARPQFGKTPNRASVDHDDEEKMRHNAKPPMDFNKYEDLLVVMMYKVGREFARRGGKEITNLRMADFYHYQITGGRLKGHNCWDLKGTHDDKMHKLGLGNNNSTVREDLFLQVIVEDKNDIEWSTYALFTRMINKHFPPGYQGHIFLHKAPQKVIDKRLKKNPPDCTQAGWDLRTEGKYKGKAHGKIGRDHPTILFRNMAKRCGFIKPERFTSRSARRAGITGLNRDKNLNPHIVNAASRHKDAATNSLYYDPHGDDVAAKATCFFYKGDSRKDDDEKKSLVVPYKIKAEEKATPEQVASSMGMQPYVPHPHSNPVQPPLVPSNLVHAPVPMYQHHHQPMMQYPPAPQPVYSSYPPPMPQYVAAPPVYGAQMMHSQAHTTTMMQYPPQQQPMAPYPVTSMPPPPPQPMYHQPPMMPTPQYVQSNQVPVQQQSVQQQSSVMSHGQSINSSNTMSVPELRQALAAAEARQQSNTVDQPYKQH